MARKIAVGISYFPLDTAFLRDTKVRRVLMACGANSIAVILALLSSIYEDEGYYIKLSEDLPFVIADTVGITEGATKEIISKLVQVGFFEKKLCSKFKILTSKGIQERYLKACERRKEVKIIKDYSLINIDEYTNVVYVDINGIDVYINQENVYKGTQNIVKDSKVNKSKVYNTPPSINNIYNTAYCDAEIDQEKFEKVVELYNYSGFQNISPSVKDTLIEFTKAYPMTWLEEAFKIATDGGKLSLNYIRGILMRWTSNGKDSQFRAKKDSQTDTERYYDQVDQWTESIKRKLEKK